jgi:hypothetical protein
MAFLFGWALAMLAQLLSLSPVSAAAIRAAFLSSPVICLASVCIAILLCAVSRHMFRWRRHRPRPKSRKPLTLISGIASGCSSLLRAVILTWLFIMCSGICFNFVASALDLRTHEVALHSDLNVVALRFASPASRQLPDLGLQARVAAYAQHLFAHSSLPSASAHIMHNQPFRHPGTNATFPSSISCTSFEFLFASHLWSRQPWPATAHSGIAPVAHALHAPVHIMSFSSSSPKHSTAHHLAVVPQGPQSAHCAIPTYASAPDYLPTNMLSPSLYAYRLPSRSGRLLVLQRLGAAAGEAQQLLRRFALQLSSWGGGARDTLAAACERAGRLGVAANQLWRQVRAHCTTSTGACTHSLGATLLELGGGAFLFRLVRS